MVNRGDAAPLRGIDAVLADALQPPQSTRVPREVEPLDHEQTKPTAAAASQDVPPTPPRTETPLDGQQFFVGWVADPLGDPFADAFGQAEPKEQLDIGSGMPSEPASPAGGPAGDAGSAAGDSSGGGGGSGATSDEPNVPSLDFGADSGTPSAPPAGEGTPSAPPPAAEPPPLGPLAGPDSATPTRALAKDFANTGGLHFEPNRGQVAGGETVQFLSRGPGYALFIRGDSTVFGLARPGSGTPRGTRPRPDPKPIDALAMHFVGANPSARIIGQDELPSRSNYFLGRAGFPDEGLIDIPNYSKLVAQNVYPGIDAIYFSNAQGKLEVDFRIAPRALPQLVQLESQGARNLSLDLGGNLLIDTASGRVVYAKPILYQTIGGVRQPVTGSYLITGANRVGFAIGAYDATRELILDPSIDYSSYLGGSGWDEGWAIEVNGSGQVYVAGETFSTDFPLKNPFQATLLGSRDAFVTKLNAKGDALVYSTYLGGSDGDSASALAIDLAGNAYITGATISGDFPTTAGAYDETFGGGLFQGDAFVAKLSATGDALIYSTFLGGDGDSESGLGIAVDVNGRAFVTGSVSVLVGDFPTTAGAFQTTPGALGGSLDGFVTAFNASGSGLVYSSYHGGSDLDEGRDIALDSANNACVTGWTGSPDFPTAAAYDGSLGGSTDAFVTKINATGTGKIYSTYLGGGGDESGYGIAMNIGDNAFVTGWTNSESPTPFPTTPGAYATTHSGGGDAFLTQLNTAGTGLVYSSYLGGTGTDEGHGIALTAGGRPTIAGLTVSNNFPTVEAVQSANAGVYDAFVSRFNVAASGSASLTFSSYLGGFAHDAAHAVAVDVLDHYYLTGVTQSINFPTRAPYQPSIAGSGDAFITKILDIPSPPVLTAITDDTGLSNSDQITMDQTLIISGTAVANSTVKLHRRNFGDLLPSVTADATGAWSFNYTGTTLAEGTYAFVGTATVGTKTSEQSREFLVTVDRTPPTVTVTVPASTPSLAPQVHVTAQDANGLPNGTQVRLDVDLNNDADYLDAGETNHTTGTLTDGAAFITLVALAGAATYRLRARVTDVAGNEGASSDQTFVVTSVTAYSVADARVRISDPIDGDSQSQLGSVQVAHALDLDRSPGSGQAGNPTLVYNSSSVSVKPIVQATINTVNNAALPTEIGIQLNWNNGGYSTAVYYPTTGLNKGDRITIAAQLAGNVTATGRYGWAVKVLIPGSPDVTASGTVFVRVEDNSVFGAGWTLSNLNKLHDIPADANGPAGKLWLYGTGGFRFFQGTTGQFTSPPEDNGILTKQGDNSFIYETPEKVRIYFDDTGKQTKWESADRKETILFSYTGSNLTGLTAIDSAASTLSYGNPGGLLSSIATAGPRTFTVAASAGDLTQITDPDTRTHGFVYDGTTHRLTQETRGALQNQFRYDTYGLADQLTWGTTASPSVTTLIPANRRGLGALYKNPQDYSGNGYWQVDVSRTDALGHVSLMQLDGGGRPVRTVAPDGGTYTYVRDTSTGSGRVNSVTDPIGRLSAYARDTAGYVTVETLPGSATRQYAYHATYHGVTTFTNERGHVFTNTYDTANGHLLTSYFTLTDVYLNTSTPTTRYNYDDEWQQVALTGGPTGGTFTLTFNGQTTAAIAYNAGAAAVQSALEALSTIGTGNVLVAGGIASVWVVLFKGTLAAANQAALTGSGSGLTGGTSPSVAITTLIDGGKDNEKQKAELTGGPTGGTFTLSFNGQTTAAIAYNASAAAVQSALEALSTIGTGNVSVTGSAGGPWTVTFVGTLAGANQPALTGNGSGLTGGASPAVAITTLLNGGSRRLRGVLDPEGHPTVYEYLSDDSARLWKTTTQLGTTEQNYDALSGEVNYLKDAKLRVTTMTLDAMGRLLTRTDPALNTESWTYTTAGLPELHTNRENQKTKNLYDAFGRGLGEITLGAQGSAVERSNLARFDVTGRTDGGRDAVGAWTTAVFTPAGHTLRITNAERGVSQGLHDLAGQLLQGRDELGNITKYQYHPRGWVTQTTDAKGKNWTQTPDQAGNVLTQTDPLNHTWQNEYDELGRARKVTDPRLNYTHTVWFGDGRVKETRDGRGFKTQLAYDFVNKKITTTQAVGTPKQRVIEQTIDEVGNVTATKDALNHTWSVGYNSLDLPMTYTDPLLHVQSTLTRDKEGRVTQNKDALNKITGFTLDALGRTTRVTDPLTHTNDFILSAVDQTVGAINGVGRLRRNVFDALGRNTLTISPLNALVRNSFDAASRPGSLTDPVVNRTAFQPDERGQMVAETDPLSASRTVIYDDAGRVQSIKDRLGRVREFSYFDNNLVQTENWRASVGGPIIWTRSFTYNGNDQLLTAADNNGTITWSYDELSRLETQQDVWAITLTNTWDPGDRLTQVTDTKGGTRNYEYDDANRNTIRKFSATGQAARLDLVYNDRDEVTELKRYSDLAGTILVGKTIFTVDDAHRLTNINHQNNAVPVPQTIDSYTYEFDNADRVTRETSMLGPTRIYGYDAESQLTSDGSGTYSYDPNGNRTMTGYVFGPGNRLISDGTWTYTWDAEGNLEKKVKNAGNEQWNYFYNHLNQMTKVERRPTQAQPVNLRVEFKYDVLGNRIEKSADLDGDGAGLPTITRFAHEGGNAWADLDSAGSLTTRRLDLGAVDALFARIGAGGQVDWYLTDRLGSVRDLMNNSGLIQDHIDYSGFGVVTNETAPSYGDRYKYAAREFDSELRESESQPPKLGYYRARWYQADVGIFTTEDPLGFGAGDPNLRRYVGNNAMNATDPSGLDAPGRAPRLNPRPNPYEEQHYLRRRLSRDLPVIVSITTDIRPGVAPGTVEQRRLLHDRTLRAARHLERAYTAIKDYWPQVRRHYAWAAGIEPLLQNREFYLRSITTILSYLRREDNVLDYCINTRQQGGEGTEAYSLGSGELQYFSTRLSGRRMPGLARLRGLPKDK